MGNSLPLYNKYDIYEFNHKLLKCVLTDGIYVYDFTSLFKYGHPGGFLKINIKRLTPEEVKHYIYNHDVLSQKKIKKCIIGRFINQY